ncbi:MAG: hypothetical protein LUC24_07300, partial [Bacteroidales bacterium]|nr:hypothetical protein [Bacteroidales bacterium]
TVTFSVSNNSSDYRTGRISVTYSSSNGSEEAIVTIAQNSITAPTITVQPVAVTVSKDGGTYSFTYSVANPVADGYVDCTAGADWVHDFDCSVSGEVSFTVDANSTYSLRTCVISVNYIYSGSVTETVGVVQDHAFGTGEDLSGIVGTYTAKGYAVDSEGVTEQTWTLKIFEYFYDGYEYALIDGLTPSVAGSYIGEGDWEGYDPTEAYIALGYLSDGALIIPTQLTGFYNNYGFIGWTPCEYSEGDWYYFVNDDGSFASDTYNICTYDESADTWTIEYGEFLALFEVDSDYNISNLSSYMDAVESGVVLTKTGDTTGSTAAPSEYVDSLARQISGGGISGMRFHPINEGLQIHTDSICKSRPVQNTLN